jgi:hypothetical protein
LPRPAQQDSSHPKVFSYSYAIICFPEKLFDKATNFVKALRFEAMHLKKIFWTSKLGSDKTIRHQNS